MTCASKLQIMVVDDDASIRESLALLLQSAGYETATAINGFDALLQLKRRLPAIVLSDLNMPQMSGFELLSVVRRRFPQISVIAMSGAYESADDLPFGVAADAFYPKGRSHPGMLLSMVAELVRTSRAHGLAHHTAPPPAWIPYSGKDANGMPFAMVTCRECLRSFPLSMGIECSQKIQETPCVFCLNVVRFVMDGSSIGMSLASRGKIAAAPQFRSQTA